MLRKSFSSLMNLIGRNLLVFIWITEAGLTKLGLSTSLLYQSKKSKRVDYRPYGIVTHTQNDCNKNATLIVLFQFLL